MVKAAKKAAAKRANGRATHANEDAPQGHDSEETGNQKAEEGHGNGEKEVKPKGTVEERLTALEKAVAQLKSTHHAHAQALKDTGILR